MNRKILLFIHSKSSPILKKSLFFSQITQRFSVNQYQDVIQLNTYSTNLPYFTIKNLKIELETSKNLKELREDLKKKYPELKFQVYEPYTNFEFSDLTPVDQIIKNDFVFKLNNTSFYKILTNLEQKPFKVFDLERSYYSNEEKELVNSLLNYGNRKNSSLILANFTKNLINELKSLPNEKINGNFLAITVKKLLGEMALKEKTYEKDLDLQVSCLENRLKYLRVKQEEVLKTYEKKGKRRVNYFLAFLTAQIALIQYGTYVAFSWDIIEPITCLLGVIDLIIAYTFWLRSDNDYSFEELKNHYVFKKFDYFNKFVKLDYLAQKNSLQKEIETLEQILRNLYLEQEVFKADWGNLQNFFENSEKK